MPYLRKFLRHPSSIPISYSLAEVAADERDYLCNISQGGLCFRSKVSIEEGQVIHITIPISDPHFVTDGFVAWSRRVGDHFEVGVKFDDQNKEFAVRMVEQVCHIEDYRERVLKDRGRRISSEEAAMEWIEKHAEDFPR